MKEPKTWLDILAVMPARDRLAGLLVLVLALLVVGGMGCDVRVAVSALWDGVATLAGASKP